MAPLDKKKEKKRIISIDATNPTGEPRKNSTVGFDAQVGFVASTDIKLNMSAQIKNTGLFCPSILALSPLSPEC